MRNTIEHAEGLNAGLTSGTTGSIIRSRALGAILLLTSLLTPIQAFGTALPGPASVALAWNPNPESDVASYQLSYGTNPGVHPNSVAAGSNTTATVTGLVEGTTYYFVVSAVNQTGLQSAASAEISYQIPVTPASVTLAWDPNPETDVASYQLSYGTSPGVHPNGVETGSNTTASVTGLVEGTTYYFVVSARNQTGLQSAASAEISYQIPVTPLSFTAWAATANLTQANMQPLATPQHDGVANLLKYAFRMNAASPDVGVISPGTGTAGLPFIALERTAETAVLRFEYLRRKHSTLIYIPRKSLDLNTWQALSSATPLSVTDLDTEWERVVIAEPCDPATPVFFGRVEVTMPTS